MSLDEESDRFGDVSVFQNIQTGRVRRDPTNAKTSRASTRRAWHEGCANRYGPSHTFVSFAFERPFVLVTDEAGSGSSNAAPGCLRSCQAGRRRVLVLGRSCGCHARGQRD